MGVTGSLSEMWHEILEHMREAHIYSTYDYLEENPPLTENDVISKYINIGRDWNEINIAFGAKANPLRFVIEGDYHHPAGIEKGLDPEGYFYEGFVTSKTVKSIAQLVEGYSRATLLNELNAQKSLYGDVLYHEDITERLLENFQRLFDLYRKAAASNNAVTIMLA